jgi:hypothetical protein
MAHFDFMGATVAAYPSVLIDGCMGLPEAFDTRPGRPRNNYPEAVEIVTREGDTRATVLHGGHNPEPHVFASGEDAQPFTDLLRAEWPVHRVSRYDSAFDVRGRFDAAHTSLDGVCRRRGLKGLLMAPVDPEDGATFYVGANNSAVRLRLYEKSKELAKRSRTWDGIEPDVLRFELQVRPERKDAKARAATLGPVEAWGVSPWSREVARDHLGEEPARVIRQPRLPSSFERTDRAMFAQYGPHIRELLARLGSWEAVAAHLARRLADEPEPHQP